MEHRKTTKILNSDEKAWRFSYLKEQFRLANLEHLFKRYITRINNAYFTLFLIAQFCINGSHFLVVLLLNMGTDTLHIVLPDLILLAVVTVLSVVGILLTETLMKKNPNLVKAACVVAFAFLYAIDIGIPVYHGLVNDVNYRPSYSTQLIIASYVFFRITNNLWALGLGIFVSASHVFVLVYFTYENSTVLWRRIGSDIVYLICVNGIGVYFRFMNEIVQRRGFLDRRACVESNLELKFVKDQEEQLMLSILPRNIIEKVKEKIAKEGNKIHKSKPFDDSYLVKHDNVTILYADIVNYTQMTTKLTPVTKLVETLNELFGSFDDESENLKVLRIKFLGDCYYCVAGLPPESIPNHADACVNLGLKMIDIIKRIREERELEIDMRIGIHTGTIIGGIIGISKWQYDVWSKDVFIANRMETTGRPGQVHITKQTKDQLKKKYNIVPAKVSDELLQKYEISQTYLISPEKPPETYDEKTKRMSIIGEDVIKISKPTTEVPVHVNKKKEPTNQGSFQRRRASGNPNLERRMNGLEKRLSGNPNLERRMSFNQNLRRSLVKRRTAFMDNNINRYQDRLHSTENKLKEAIDSMPLSKYDQWLRMSDINPMLLLFKDLKKEVQYMLQPDPLFKYYLLIELIVLTCIILIQSISMPHFEWTTILELCTIASIVLIFVPLTWTQYIWNSFYRKRNESVDSESAKSVDNNDDNNNDDFDMISYYEMDIVDPDNLKMKMPRTKIVQFLYKTSDLITKSACLRTIIYLCLCSIFTVCVFTEMLHCDYEESIAPRNIDISNLGRFFYNVDNSKKTASCVIPWHMTETCILAIGMNFLFLRIHAWLKLVFGIVVTSLYSFCLWYYTRDYYENSETFNHNVKPYLAHILSMVYITFTLHLINRQSDYMNRLDHNWNQQLIEEEDEASVIGEINYNLLKNILPIHVAKLYLNVNRSKELYYEEYTNVAVMFASIVDYQIEHIGPIKFVKIMDQIICDFDELLLTENYKHKIEKIKLANWTYMAACGLIPGRKNDRTNEQPDTSGEENVVTLLRFAVGIRKILRKINIESHQRFKLRIGICHGELTAGVVGSKKPLYDIWGDTVNMASRMDSTGKPNEIQATENTAMALKKNGIKCEFRDYIFVKGKSKDKPDVPTYFVSLDENDDLICEGNEN